MKWSIHGDGKSITPGEVVAPDERLHWPQTISIGAHARQFEGARNEFSDSWPRAYCLRGSCSGDACRLRRF